MDFNAFMEQLFPNRRQPYRMGMGEPINPLSMFPDLAGVARQWAAYRPPSGAQMVQQSRPNLGSLLGQSMVPGLPNWAVQPKARGARQPMPSVGPNIRNVFDLLFGE